jgi:alkylation response protein AidB-like acyl-CoA dehydrogenase
MADATEAQSREVAEASRQKEWRKPSFMKELFLGNFRLDLISPYPNFGQPERPEYTEFVARLKQYFLDELDPVEIDETGAFPPGTIERLAELGALGMNMPKEYGGMGFTKSEYCRTMELSASYEGSMMGFLSPHQSVGVPECIKLFGTPEQKKEFLPRCAKGEVSAFALTENEVGSDPARLTTTLSETPEGDAWLLNGTKLWCTNGLVAKLLVVMARHAESDQISAVVVEADWPGVSIEHRCHFMGLSALQNGVLQFTNVRVPKKNVIAAPGKGLRVALTALNTGRLSIPYGALSCAKKALEMSRVWASQRKQWGKALYQHEAIGHKLTRMAATVFAMETVIDLACQLTDRNELDTRLESAASKEWNTSRAWELMDDAMQIRGGRGYEKESSLRARGERPMPVERIMRDMRVQRIFEGASEIMHLLMAREAVDKHLEVAGAMIDPKASMGTKLAALPKIAAFYATWYPSRWFSLAGRFGYGEYGDLAPHLRYVHRASQRLARQAFHGMLRYQAGLEKRQGFLFRWVDIAMELYAMAALCSRTHAMVTAGVPEAKKAAALCDVFCRQAQRKADRLFHELWHNDDDLNTTTAKAVAEGHFTWLERGIVTLDEADAAHDRRHANALAARRPESDVVTSEPAGV